MKHAILLILTSLIFTTACKKKEKTEPEPEEYFSFYADGEYFDYPQNVIPVLGQGESKTLKAWGAGTAGYIIRGYSREDPVARGYVTLYIHGGQIPDQDTVILDGITNNAVFSDFKYQSNNYVIEPPLKGKIIFTKRTSQKLEGTFEFDAYHVNYDNHNRAVTDTIIHITNGKFAIIPSI